MADIEEDEIVRPSQAEIDKRYKPGSIKRVKLKNFLTYDAVEFYPGPRLNVVVGPNGTGKSTILCAICLGLGGQPPLLGRADDARQFIKHEKDQAIIEIELMPYRNGPVHVIKRVIDRDKGSEHGRGKGASTYFVNNQKVALKAVQELVAERYHIHIDNLCTFLPQDKVGNFSGFDKQALLAETEKSLSGQLYDTHQELIKLESEVRSSGCDVQTVEEKLKNLEAENRRLEREKELMEERQSYLERIELLRKKRAWLIFDAKRLEALEVKEERANLKNQLKEAQKQIKPVKEKHAQMEGEVSKIKSRYTSLENKVKKDRKTYEDCETKTQTFQDNIENTLAEFQSIDAHQRRAEREVQAERKRLEEIQAEGASFPPMDEVEDSLRKAQSELRETKSKLDAAKRRAGSVQDKIDAEKQKEDEASQKLARLNDEKSLRRQRLFGMFQGLKDAFEWIDQNRKMFRRPIHGPIGTEVQPKSALTAAYLEHHVSSNTWRSFVVECPEDYKLLYREVREKKGIPINITTVPQGRLKPVTRMYSDCKMDVLRREHGFFGYLDETFTAPDPIMQALINNHNVDKVIVGGEEVQKALDRKDLIELLSTREAHDKKSGKVSSCFFYTHNRSSYRYTSQPSRFSGEIGTSSDEVQPARLLKPGCDPNIKEELSEIIKKAKETIENLLPAIQEGQIEMDEWHKHGQHVSVKLKDSKRLKQEWTQYKAKLRNQKEKLAEAEEDAAKDNEREKVQMVNKIKKLVENSIKESESAAKAHNECMKSTHALTGVKMTEDGLSDNLRKLGDLLQERMSETAELESRFKQTDKLYTTIKDSLKKLRDDAQAIAPQNEWGDRLQEDDMPEDLDGLEDALDEAENKVNSITDNPHVTRQYEERKVEIERCREQLENMNQSQGMKNSQLKQKLGAWQSKLINIQQDVNGKFSEYMKEVGCAGEIRLYTGGETSNYENGEENQEHYNFKDWGIEILVKFREASKLQVLSAQTHSGGERSVSTIMYLMGLQNLMKSPFRCVDEINQGLDERNERLVFKRIVKNSTIPTEPGKSLDDHCGQYFLITPKLLPNLDGMENENITVLFVFSGPENFADCLDWNVDKFIAEKKRVLLTGGDWRSDGGTPKRKRRSR
mmetsp:Transcript_26638/g.55195  ORF Transcript_26638/g.55195 Transcript_26638/m.55195 type:complete len:1127 (+) Transcript_26638:256-3636(+)